MNDFKAAWNWLALEPHQRKGLRVLQICLGMMLLFRVSSEGRFASFLWGPHGIARGAAVVGIDPIAARLDGSVFSSEARTAGVVVALGLGAAGLVCGWRTRLSTGLALAAFFMLEKRLPELGDGGDNITRLALTYMLFALPAGLTPKRGSLAVWLHNIAILAIGLQIGVLYFTSGFMKATGAKWSNGTAMYLISQVEWFSHPALRGFFANPFVSAITTYGTVLFQIWFPVVVLTRLRLVWLASGIAMHLGIATFMGLICFSMAMIGLELFLVRDGEYNALQAWLEQRGTAIRARLARRQSEPIVARIEER
jgi:hypothetical protein